MDQVLLNLDLTNFSEKDVFSKKRINTKQLSKAETIASSHRLAKIQKPYNPSRPIKIDSAEEYAVKFFENNPNISIDKRDPMEKIDSINKRLEAINMTNQERFSLLTQRKSLAFIAFGENTREYFNAVRDLASFYNEQHRPESAQRHLKKVKAMMEHIDLQDDDKLFYAIEFAISHLEAEASTKHEADKHVEIAERFLEPYLDVQTSNDNLNYKRHRAMARIKAQKGLTEDAITLYGDAIVTYTKLRDYQNDEIVAELYVELGSCYEALNDHEEAREAYRSAHGIYMELNLPLKAAQFEEIINE